MAEAIRSAKNVFEFTVLSLDMGTLENWLIKIFITACGGLKSTSRFATQAAWDAMIMRFPERCCP